MSIEDLTPGEKFIWEWRSGGRMSDFKRALIHLIMRADVQNQERLRLGFPDEIESYMAYKLIPGWWDDLEARMDGEEAKA